MVGIPRVNNALDNIKPNGLDDYIDRFSYYFTTVILLTLTTFAVGKMYLTDAMQCWAPQQWKDAWHNYAKEYCFATGSYYLAPNESIPVEIDDRMKSHINYYQWVPVILSLQALLFYLPSCLWAVLVSASGLDAFGIVSKCVEESAKDMDKRRKGLKEVAALLAEHINVQRRVGTKSCRLSCCVSVGRDSGCTLTSCYVLTKALYAANALAQLYFINSFLGDGTEFWGLKMARALLDGSTSYRSRYFPMETLCDIVVRDVGNEQGRRSTIQCILSGNIFVEKVFVFLWLWFALVALLSAASLLYAAADMCNKRRRHQFIRKTMCLAVALGAQSDEMSPAALDAFVRDQLRPDGVLIMKFIAQHCGDASCADICASLWSNYERAKPSLVHSATATSTFCGPLDGTRHTDSSKAHMSEVAMNYDDCGASVRLLKTAKRHAPQQSANVYYTRHHSGQSVHYPTLAEL